MASLDNAKAVTFFGTEDSTTRTTRSQSKSDEAEGEGTFGTKQKETGYNNDKNNDKNAEKEKAENKKTGQPRKIDYENRRDGGSSKRSEYRRHGSDIGNKKGTRDPTQGLRRSVKHDARAFPKQHRSHRRSDGPGSQIESWVGKLDKEDKNGPADGSPGEEERPQTRWIQRHGWNTQNKRDRTNEEILHAGEQQHETGHPHHTKYRGKHGRNPGGPIANRSGYGIVHQDGKHGGAGKQRDHHERDGLCDTEQTQDEEGHRKTANKSPAQPTFVPFPTNTQRTTSTQRQRNQIPTNHHTHCKNIEEIQSDDAQLPQGWHTNAPSAQRASGRDSCHDGTHNATRLDEIRRRCRRALAMPGLPYEYNDNLNIAVWWVGKPTRGSKDSEQPRLPASLTGQGFNNGSDYPSQPTLGPSTNFPLYTPNTGKMDMEHFVKSNKTSYRWLFDANLYELLLRDTPNAHRTRFRNKRMLPYVQQLLQVGIIVGTEARNIKSWCILSLKEEPEKSRNRLIIEPRTINSAMKPKLTELGLNCTFPSLRDIKDAINGGDEVSEVDYKCYYYQFPLSEPVQHYFGVDIEGESYRLTVLAMGFCASCKIAQDHSEETVQQAELDKVETVLIQIDNTYIFTKQEHTTLQMTKFLRACSTIVVGKCTTNTEATILGVLANLNTKMIKLPETFTERHSALIKKCTVERTFPAIIGWRMMAVLLRTAYILNKPLCNFFFAIKFMRRTASQLCEGTITWTTIVTPQDTEMAQWTELAQIFFENKAVTTLTHHSGEQGQTIFSDASDIGWGIVANDGNNWYISADQ